MNRYRTTGTRLLALLAGSALVLSACGGGGGGDTDTADTDQEPKDSGPAAKTITHAYEQEFVSYNSNTASDNAAKNSIVLQRVLTGFWYFNETGAVTPNTEFGKYQKTSDDPLTVEYEIDPKAVWSDGTPIDCDDALLFWAASGKRYGFSSASTIGIEDVKLPDCKAGDKKFVFEYEKPFGDWESIGPGSGMMLPAHVVAKQGGLDEAAFIEAIKKGDTAALKKAADFYNTGWVMGKKQLLDESLIPSSGPYKLSKWDAGQSITLVANDKYWGTPAKTKTIVIRFISQEEQAQALQNREVQIAEPQPNPDLVNQFEGMQGIKVEIGDAYFYDHLDFNFSSSPFKDKRLRQAFANCVPRQLIVDNLIKPMYEDAKPLAARNVAPFEPNYQAIAGEGEALYTQPDIATAKKLLQQAGKTKLDVKIGYQLPNPRRAQVVKLIKDSCDKAGFNVIDQGADDFFDTGGGLATNTYDVALFGWTGSALVSGWASTFRSPTACTPEGKENNNGCYSNKRVDELIDKINQSVDKDEQNTMIKEVEEILWEDLVTIPLYSNPNLTAYDETLTGIKPNPSQASVTWNMDQWAAQ